MSTIRAKGVPLETLFWQGLPERNGWLARKSVMSKDNVLNVSILFICILHNSNELYKMEGSFARTDRRNPLFYKTIHLFYALFHPAINRGFLVFLLTVIFQTSYHNHPTAHPPFARPFSRKHKSPDGTNNAYTQFSAYCD